MSKEVRARLRSRNNQQGKEDTGKEETKDQGQSFLHLPSSELLASLANRGSHIPSTEKEMTKSLRDFPDARRLHSVRHKEHL